MHRSARRPHRHHQAAQGAIEYALALALIALLVVAAVTVVGHRVNNAFCGVQNGFAHGGQLEAWGANSVGQLGRGDLVNSSTPTPVPTICGVTVAAGWQHTVVVKPDQTVWAFGANNLGETGASTVGSTNPTPVQVMGLPLTVSQVSAGEFYSMALTSSGAVYTWGSNEYGTLGTGSSDSASHPTPVLVPGLPTMVQVSAGQFSAYALDASGNVWSWGDDSGRELGLGASPPTDTTCTIGVPFQPSASTATCGVSPQKVTGVTGVKQVTTEGFTFYALTSAGAVWAWGLNQNGSLGDGQNYTAQNNSGVPVQVLGINGAGLLAGVTSVASGRHHAVALLSSGAVVAWGTNTPITNPTISYGGVLGTGNTTTDALYPVQVLDRDGVTPLRNVTMVGASRFASYAVQGGNTLIWGTNAYGELGPNGPANGSAQSIPVLVPGLPATPIMMSGGAYTTFALVPAVTG